MRVREMLKLDSDDGAGEIGALGAGAGVVVGVVFVSDGNPLLGRPSARSPAC